MKGALLTGQPKDAGVKTLMMSHDLRRNAARKMFCQNESPPPPP